jgi:hypothetical protein
MKGAVRQKIASLYEDVGAADRIFLFVHGWARNHRLLESQIEHFGRSYRVIAPDLRGHRDSSAPHRGYTVPCSFFTSRTGLLHSRLSCESMIRLKRVRRSSLCMSLLQVLRVL